MSDTAHDTAVNVLDEVNIFPRDDDDHKNNRYKEPEADIWQATKQYLLRPGVVGGLIGLVNIGIIARVGHAFYTQPHLRHDAKVIASTVTGAIALLGAEGFAANQYSQTPAGQEGARRAKEDGTALYKHTREIVLRPGVLGGLVGLLNTTIVGIVGYYSYINWDKPLWDRRTVSAISVGLLTLWGGEGVLAKRYRESRR